MIFTSKSELLPSTILPGSKVPSNILSQNSESNFVDIFNGFNSNSLDIHSSSPLFSLEDEKFEYSQFEAAFLKERQIPDNDRQAVNLIEKSNTYIIEPKITTMKNLTAAPENHLNKSRPQDPSEGFGMKSNHTKIKGERESAGSIEKTHGKTVKYNTAGMEIPIDVRKSTIKGKSKQAEQNIIRYSINSFEKVSVNKTTVKTTRIEDKIEIRNTAQNNNFEIEKKSIKSDNLSVKSVDNSKKENDQFKVRNGEVKLTVKSSKNVYHGFKVSGKVDHSIIRNNDISPLNNKTEIRNTNNLIINSKGSTKQINHNKEYRKDQAASQDKIKNHSKPIEKSAEKNIKKNGITTDKTIYSRKSKVPVNPLLILKEDFTFKIDENTKISDQINLLKLSEINTVFMNRFHTPIINSTGLSSLGLIQRISQTIYQSMVTNQTQSNFTIDGGRFGSFEFRYNHDQVGTHVTVVVESEATRSYLQKIIPTIIENLYRKGMPLDSLEVQVGFFDKPNTQERNDNTNSRKVLKSNKHVKVTNVDNEILKIRDYGYNTMEILA